MGYVHILHILVHIMSYYLLLSYRKGVCLYAGGKGAYVAYRNAYFAYFAYLVLICIFYILNIWCIFCIFCMLCKFWICISQDSSSATMKRCQGICITTCLHRTLRLHKTGIMATIHLQFHVKHCLLCQQDRQYLVLQGGSSFLNRYEDRLGYENTRMCLSFCAGEVHR